MLRKDRADLWDSLPPSAKVKRYQAFGFELGVENDALRRKYMQAYHACISFIDAQIALVFEQLKTERLWDDTIIVFTSDHGYHLGEHFLWGKVSLFDIGAKVPFLVREPGLTEAGSRSDAMVELIDVYPTLADLCELKAPAHLQGDSLVPVLRDASAAGPNAFAYTVVSRGDRFGHTIRNQRWRYALWPDGEELYDLQRDPEELQNLAKRQGFEQLLSGFRKQLASDRNRIAQNRTAKPAHE